MSAAAAMLPGLLAARLGGDEFCVLIEGYGAEDAVQVPRDPRSSPLRTGFRSSTGRAWWMQPQQTVVNVSFPLVTLPRSPSIGARGL
jgi:GGDEF domain-containing protein